MNSTGLQQNLIWLMENKTNEVHKDPGRRLCCEKCRFSTKDVDLFGRHVAHHEQVTFSCNLCSHVSYSRVESQRHIVSHKGSFPYKCNWCSYGAVRRDYMVKHIQRIHGKPANGSFTSYSSLSTAKMEHLQQTAADTLQQTDDLCAPRTLGDPVQLVSHSSGNVLSLFPSVTQPRVSAPYFVVRPVHQTSGNQTHLITASQPVTSTTCILPVPKSVGTPHVVSSAGHAGSKVSQGISNPPSVTVHESNNRIPGKTSLGKVAGSLPRVHVTIPAERVIQQKALHQGQVGTATEKTVIQSKGVADNQFIFVPSDRTTQQKPLHQGQVGAATEKIDVQSKALPKSQTGLAAGSNTHLKTLLSKPVELFSPKAAEAVRAALAAQRSVHTGVIRNVPVAQTGQKSVPGLGPNPSLPLERFGQGGPPFPHGTQNAEKDGRKKARPNVLVRQPAEKLEPSAQSSVQVELLAPLNQPIEHNKPLTVSCPEEITIPAGCLVELVEVKNVNGTRELELRLVPQHPSGPQLGSPSWSTAGDSTASRLSFKCRVSTDDDKPRLTHGTGTSQINEQQIKGACQKQKSKGITIDVKDEPEVTEQVLCSKMSVTEIQGSSSGGYYGVLKSVARPSQKVARQASTGLAKAPEQVTPVDQMHCRGASQRPNDRNVTAKGVECQAAQASSNRNEDPESSFQGFPVISSVFSLCPSPEATLDGVHIRVGILEGAGKAQISSDVGNKALTNVEDSTVCKLKTEEETGLLTENVQNAGQLFKENKESLLEDTKVPDCVVPEKPDDVRNSSQVFPKDVMDRISPEVCSSSTGVLQTAPADDPPLEKNAFPSNEVQNEDHQETARSESPALAQTESSPALPMNPTVALVRMPSLDFYSLLEFSRKDPEKPDGEESVTARPVLCCTSNQQNMQERAIKLVLKRKRTETENKDAGEDLQPLVARFDILHPHKKHKKEKRKDKKHKLPKVVLDLHQILAKGKMEKLCLTPLKEDQPVKLPAPNQPVVVLNHPNPLFQMVGEGVQNLNDYGWISSGQNPQTVKEDAPVELVNQCPSFKMKLKKVQGQNYQVTELVLKGVSEKMVL